MKQDISRKATVSNITGCLLFLQVFYLDNIQLGDLSMTHDVFPIIKAFTTDKIRAMINADKRPMDSSKNGDFIYGISAPCDADSSAYSRADDQDNAQQGGMLGHAKLNLYNELKAHQEGIIKHVEVMNAKFYGKIYRMLNDNNFTRNKGVMHASGSTIVSRDNNATKSSTVEADMASDVVDISFICWIANVSIPEKRNDEAFVLHMQNKRPRVDIDATSNAMDVDLNVADLLASTPEGNTMDPSFDFGLDFTPSPKVGKNKSVSSRYQDGGYALFEYISDGDAADINNGSQGVTSSCGSWRNDGIAGGSSDGQGPNQSSHTPSACPSDNLGTPASSVADSVPPYWYLGEQTRSSSPTSVYKIIQDYFMRVMAGDMPCQHKSIRGQFIGDHITYDVPNCMLIMFPAYVSFAWVCYAIHTIKKKVFIYDPTLASENGGAIKQLHMRNCNLLKSAMSEFAKTYFESWDFGFGDLEPAIIHPKRQVSERHLSGFYTMNFCRNFIGDQETDNIHVDDDSSLAAYYLYNILHLKGNNAKRSHQFIESIDE
ncbi:hypothetical protein VPH35_057944 [Triticum aestivum]